MFGIDPSKLDPKTLEQMSALIRELPMDRIMAIQNLMQRSMAGQDVTREMQEFERTLPPGFREKMAKLMYQMHGVDTGGSPPAPSSDALPGNEREARLTILRAVQSGSISPEAAYDALF